MSRVTKELKTLECTLTEGELLLYSKELGEKISEKNRLEASKKSYTTQIDAEIATNDARIATLAEKVYSGREYRDVECRISYDFVRGIKTFTRNDTFEVVKEEIISEKELQEEAML